MAARRALSSPLLSRLASMTVAPSSVVVNPRYSARFFSGKDSDDKGSSKPGEIEEDPFGVHYEDGTDHGKLGPSSELPPKYVRDAATGKFTGEVEAEVTDEERRLLKMDDLQKERVLMERLVEEWDQGEKDEAGDPEQQARVARRIREEETALNTIGRSAEAQSVRGITEEGEEAYMDETGFSTPLSPGEFRSFQEYMKQEHGAEVTEEDIPVQNVEGDASKTSAIDNPDLDLTWLTVAAQRAMDDDAAENDPFLDLMPSDLRPARKVNRRRAKLIPKSLLHHNNMSLLRRYVTPGGQIMNRVQSRLGAKDQRKIAKLIKRARHLGLIPYMGQWKYENHGNIYEKNIDEEKEWEKELIRRGLVKSGAGKKDNQDNK